MQRASLALGVGRGLTLALGIRAAYLALRYVSGSPGTQRHHVESAVVTLIVVGALLMLVTSDGTSQERDPGTTNAAEWALWCSCSLLLYWPSMSVGLLSDDFVLAGREELSQFGLVHGEFFRPLPLLLWSAILPVTGAAGLHAVNVVAHGLVAFLASRLAEPFVGSRSRAVVAGLVVLTCPTSVEAVTWISGVFDVTAALLVLGAVLTARRYQSGDAGGTRIAMVSCAIAASFCKETAIVAPGLIALDGWARRRLTRTLLADLGGLSIVFGVASVVRFLLASDLLRQPLSKYLVQR